MNRADGCSGARLIIPRRRQGVIIFIVQSQNEEKSGALEALHNAFLSSGIREKKEAQHRAGNSRTAHSLGMIN